jgi:GT2 family glycosyltransferase
MKDYIDDNLREFIHHRDKGICQILKRFMVIGNTKSSLTVHWEERWVNIPEKKISVIVVDYKNPLYTKRCLDSLYNTHYSDMQIKLIDNSNYNIGLAAAQNKGAKLATGEYLFFLNNDTLVKPDIFDRLLESKFDVTGCRMFNYTGKKELDSTLSIDRFGYPAGKTGPVFYPDGAIFIKRQVFEEIGGFDEKLFLYGEDRDLLWRAWLAGYTVGYNADAVFFHNSSCVSNTNFHRRKISERNILRSIIKNYSLKNLPWILIQYSFWSILEIGYILLTKPQAIWYCYLPAYWWNIINLRDTLKARKKVIRRIPDSKVPFSKVIGKLWVLKNIGIPKWV